MEIEDAVGIFGLVLIVTGVAFWSLPAALILTGMILVAFAYWRAGFVLKQRSMKGKNDGTV
jgi:uncharacterized sodium:solute symporter family permease YidK